MRDILFIICYRLTKQFLTTLNCMKRLARKPVFAEIEKRCLSLTVNCDFPSLFKSLWSSFSRKNYDIFRDVKGNKTV